MAVTRPALRYYDDGQVTLLHGDVRECLREMPAESVNCVVTSPPYWSLRDYGVEATVWGGEGDCEHEWGVIVEQQRGGTYSGKTRWQHIADEANEAGVPVRTISPESWGLEDGHPKVASGQFCSKCGAWLGALGLEPTPEMFVAHMVEVFREVRRVLRNDGTLWLNIGDCYATGGGRVGEAPGGGKQGEAWRLRGLMTTPNRMPLDGLKAKDLVGIPWMLAFALRADGWWLRQDIIWSKPNPMPESVRDRCTKAHEYLFLLSKSDRYWSDFSAIRESAGYPSDRPQNSFAREQPDIPLQKAQKRKNRTVRPGVDTHGGAQGNGYMEYPEDTRNKRSVWHIPTAPFPEAHFATFPPALVEPCVLAGCPEGGVVPGTRSSAARDDRDGGAASLPVGLGIDLNGGSTWRWRVSSHRSAMAL